MDYWGDDVAWKLFLFNEKGHVMIASTVSKWAILIFVAGFFGSAHAQENLGGLLDKGAKKVSKDEWSALLPVNVSYIWLSKSGTFSLTYKADGSHTGSAQHFPSGTSSGAYGTWKIDESGKICVVEKFSNAYWTTQEFCYFLFQLDGQPFASDSDIDRSARISKATIDSKK